MYLKEVSSLCDQLRVQVWFSPDVVGVLQKLLPLRVCERKRNGKKGNIN